MGGCDVGPAAKHGVGHFFTAVLLVLLGLGDTLGHPFALFVYRVRDARDQCLGGQVQSHAMIEAIFFHVSVQKRCVGHHTGWCTYCRADAAERV